MQDIIQWCNDNQGFLMALLTGVYVLATIVIALLGAHANFISQKNIATLTELEQERSRPFVDVRLENDIPFLVLTVSNHGQTPAYDVRITTTPRLRMLLGGKSMVPNVKVEKPIGIIEYGIGSLGAGASVSTLIGSFARVREAYPDMHFTGSVSYRASTAKTYETSIDLDVRYMETSISVNKKTIHDVATQLEKIENEIGWLASGFHKPHVITEDIEHKQAADEALVDELERRKMEKQQPTVQRG